MDIAYSVKQLDHEIKHLEARIHEKRTVRDKLWSVLTPQEQALLNAPLRAVSPQRAGSSASAQD